LFRIPLFNYPLAYLIRLWALLFLSVDLSQVSPADRVRQTNVPILLIHSSIDDVVPFSQAEALRRALANNPSAEFWFRDGYIHGELGADYRHRIRDFFLKHL
jgi:fermentation-respiration switch protein FrsA (DUF1100 family)